MQDMIINKVFIEVRYPDSLMFNDMSALQSICNSLISIVPNRNFDKANNFLIITSEDDSFRVTISNNRLILDHDQPNDYGKFKELSNEVLRIVTEKLMIDYVTRIGMRSLRGIEKTNEYEACEYICSNYANKVKTNSNMIGEMVGFGINMSFERKDYRINLALMPNSLQTITVTPAGSSETKRCEVQVDTDVYLNSVNDIPRLYNNFIDDVIRINENEIVQFIRKMSE